MPWRGRASINSKSVVPRKKMEDNAASLHQEFVVPFTKLKNVSCVACKRKFFISDFKKFKEQGLPLLLDCGHPVCKECAVNKSFYKCPVCNAPITTNYDEKMALPLNLYVLGLIASSYHNTADVKDAKIEDFQFCRSVAARLRQIKSQGSCHECGMRANVNCPQCMALFCFQCYTKLHGKALQNHKKIPINERSFSYDIFDSCLPICSDSLCYFCNDCNIPMCPNCMLQLHQEHNYITILEKNKELIPEFQAVYRKISDNMQRIYDSRKKMRDILTSSSEIENSKAVEASITEHFTHLHGILQRLEMKLLEQLYEPHKILKQHLDQLDIQLQLQEDQLVNAMKLANLSNENFARVDLRNTIQTLQSLANVPCHLVYDTACQNDKIKLCFDPMIIEALKRHCVLLTPSMSNFKLLKEDKLPENYQLEPVMQDLFEIELFNKSSTSTVSPMKLSPSLTEIPNESKQDKEQGIFQYQVEVTYVINPSLFYVRKLSSKAKFIELEEKLMQYEERNLKLIDIEKDKMCLVKQIKNDKWYRGYVKKVNVIDDKNTYNVFYVDYGHEECNISVSRIQNIPDDCRELLPQAIRCRLQGVVPRKTTWTNASTNDFMRLTTESEYSISVYVIKSIDDTQYVDLCVSSLTNSRIGPQSICNALILMNHARVDISQEVFHIRTNSGYMYGHETLSFNKMTKVSIDFIVSPDICYVSKIGLRRINLLKLMDRLNQYYEENPLVNEIEVPEKGLACAVLGADNTWHRGEITEVCPNNKAKIFHVDIGHSLIYDWNAVRMIPVEFTLLCKQAIKIKSMRPLSENNELWKSDAIDPKCAKGCLSNNINIVDIEPCLRIEDGYEAIIYMNNDEVPHKKEPSSNLSSNRFTKQSRKKFTMSKKSNDVKKETHSSSDSEDSKINEEDEAIKDPFKVEVTIKRVVTPDLIYVAQIARKEINAKLISAMQIFYNNYQSESHDNWSEGAICTVYSAKDKSYLRAKILQIKSADEVIIYFYDMGIEEQVTIKDIQALHPKFAKEPTYCFIVKLAGILPCGGSSAWPSLSCTTLSDIIDQNARFQFYITKLEEPCDNVIPVQLWVKQLKIPGPLEPSIIEINSINRMLVEAGVALPVKDYLSDSVLAKELKRQLKDHRLMPSFEGEMKWFTKDLISTNCEKRDVATLSDSFHSETVILPKYLKCPKLPDWLPPPYITEEVFHAIPTYVDNNCAIYLHSKKHNTKILQFIQNELQGYFKSNKIRVHENINWKVGDLCIAQYHQNKKWYRGRVTKLLGNTLQVEFVDYGNTEECELEHVTDEIRLEHIPIQCTKCIVHGLKPATENRKWLLHDLDRIHALLVDKECKVTVLKQQSTHLIISIIILHPWKCDLFSYLQNYLHIKIESKNDNSESTNISEDTLENILNYRELDIMKSSALSHATIESQNNDIISTDEVISGNSVLIDPSKQQSNDNYNISDFENINWLYMIDAEKNVASSTPQHNSQENLFNGYKPLKFPPELKYVELILCCNKTPTVALAQLAENKDIIFNNELHNYYLQYEAIMSDMQINARNQPFIPNLVKDTPCVTKFLDEKWYRCIITDIEKFPNTSEIYVALHYVDFGNHEQKILKCNTNHDLREPKKEWLNVPIICIECKFWGIDFIQNNAQLLASKLSEVYNKPVVALVKAIQDNMLEAMVYTDKTCNELLYSNIIENGLFKLKKTKED